MRYNLSVQERTDWKDAPMVYQVIDAGNTIFSFRIKGFYVKLSPEEGNIYMTEVLLQSGGAFFSGSGWLNLVWFLLIGLVAGWLAGLLLRGQGFGCSGNILIGAIGGLIGGFLFAQFGIDSFRGFLGSLLTALVGAIVLLFVVGLLRKIIKR